MTTKILKVTSSADVARSQLLEPRQQGFGVFQRGREESRKIAPFDFGRWVQSTLRRFTPTGKHELILLQHELAAAHPELHAQLLALLRGDSQAALKAIDAISRFPIDHHFIPFDAIVKVGAPDVRPLEAKHLIYPPLWRRSDEQGRREIIETLTLREPHIGDRRMREDLFVEFAARDGSEAFYTTMLGILEQPRPSDPKAQFHVAQIFDVTKGWASEDPKLDRLPEISARLEKLT